MVFELQSAVDRLEEALAPSYRCWQSPPILQELQAWNDMGRIKADLNRLRAAGQQMLPDAQYAELEQQVEEIHKDVDEWYTPNYWPNAVSQIRCASGIGATAITEVTSRSTSAPASARASVHESRRADAEVGEPVHNSTGLSCASRYFEVIAKTNTGTTIGQDV